MARFVFLLLFALASLACKRSAGKIAFTIADTQALGILEAKYFQPSRFQQSKQTPIFETDDVIWFAYKPTSPQLGARYAISLLKKGLGFQEIDLRNQVLDSSRGLIIDSYRHLDAGEYKIRFAVNNESLDEFNLLIVEDSDVEVVNYDAEEI